MSKTADQYFKFHHALVGFRQYLNGRVVDKATLFHALPTSLVVEIGSAANDHALLKIELPTNVHLVKKAIKARGTL